MRACMSWRSVRCLCTRLRMCAHRHKMRSVSSGAPVTLARGVFWATDGNVMCMGREQKEQLERMLEEQQMLKAKDASSPATRPPPRASRTRVPKPIVK